MTLLSTSVATSPSGQLHDRVGGDTPCALAAHVLDERESAARLLRRPRLAHPHRVAVDLELHLGIREQPELLPDVLRDGDLALAGDARQYYSYQ